MVTVLRDGFPMVGGAMSFIPILATTERGGMRKTPAKKDTIQAIWVN